MTIRDYDAPKRVTKEQARLVLEGTNSREIREVLVSIALLDDDFDWAETTCLRFTKHGDDEIREVAITCLGHIARIHGRLISSSRKSLSTLADDPTVGGHARDALSDVAIFARDA